MGELWRQLMHEYFGVEYVLLKNFGSIRRVVFRGGKPFVYFYGSWYQLLDDGILKGWSGGWEPLFPGEKHWPRPKGWSET